VQTALLALGIAFAAILGLAVLSGAIWAYWDTRRRQQRLIGALDSLSGIGRLPEYLAGLEKICADQVKAVLDLNASVEKFRVVMFPGSTDSQRKQDLDGFVAYSDEAADQAAEMEELIAQGYGVQEAKERVQASRMRAKQDEREQGGLFRLGR
jgi:hypothetical protein